mgnify:CR=1 FL=1
MPYQKIGLLVGAIVVIIGGLYAVSLFTKTDDGSGIVTLPDGTSTTTTKGPGYTIELVGETSLLDLAPDLDRGIRFGSSVPEDFKALLMKRMENTVTALKKDPSQPGEWLDLAIWYHTASDFEGAREVWEFLIKVAPQDTTAYDNLGRMYHYDLKEFAKSEPYFLESKKIRPDALPPYIELFQLYSLSYKKGTSAAVDIMKEAQAKYPTDAGLYFTLAVYYRDRGDLTNARAELLKALDLARQADNIELIKQLNEEIAKLPYVQPNQ